MTTKQLICATNLLKAEEIPENLQVHFYGEGDSGFCLEVYIPNQSKTLPGQWRKFEVFNDGGYSVIQ